MRLFVAVTLGPTVEAHAREGLERLKPLAPRARWVPLANLHLTLSFLGEVDAGRLPAVEQALGEVGPAHGPLVLTLGGGGGFGAPTHPRVLWAGVGGDTRALGALQAHVAGVLKPLGFEPEHRDYVAHLTLARSREAWGDRDLATCVPARQTARGGEARVERLVLFESRGGQYLPRREVPLSLA